VSGCKRTIPNQRKMMNIMKENEMKNSYDVDDIKWSLMVNQLRDNIDINKMSQDIISELFLDNRKIIGSRIYLQKDNNT
jgi:PBP1b-binding outer membrane lipoprotein LpoB